ncbi:efflux RND transporter periplasmic adaptor subunit [Massilia sp. NEAU-DD11]|uniref:Efflux RND transporter periplasmic adaptor subunit n=1 Tax=Massilia cellulosiltytica TaxID=2683234 RepID=A0A7X3FYX4_9BURK|nr:efflux RND transporter periplasmic adaptor subunit [Telluria cellulosilytica]MVW59592.1 efflux RND transporter periplasmic adaptor subunit [Telluria cellulosilytica]
MTTTFSFIPAFRTPRTAALASVLLLAACARTPPPEDKKPPLVSVTTARAADIPIELGAQGHVVPLEFVDVRPQLTGTIRTVDFHEGDDIRKGQLLFTLDDSDARAQLGKAQAQVALVAAQLADARRDHQRAQALVASKFVAASSVDTAASKVEALVAQAHAAAAEVSSARTALAHTRIHAPIAGKAGAVAVHPGSLAQVGAAAPLVTIAQFAPVGVEFDLPEKDLPALLAARAAGAVRVSIAAAAGKTPDGALSFVNNAIDQDSASIHLKAAFPNTDHTLWPGAFVRVVVHAGVSRGAVVLPPQAVQDGPGGRFVFIAAGDGKVSSRPVDLLRVQGGMAVIGGLDPGVPVVLEGGQNLRPGARVRIAADAAPPATVAMVRP